jgi:hypothetical protein
MATVFIKLYHPSNDAPPLASLRGAHCEIGYLKSIAPDDGEAVGHEGRFSIACPDEEWQEVLERLKQSGESLVYSVVQQGVNGESNIAEAGELNAEVLHYTTRSNNRKQIFAYWFQDCLPEQQLQCLAA